MNKYLIILLLVCLVSVHAFVKRDAPEAATEKNMLDDIKKQAEQAFNTFSEKAKEFTDPEKLKKGWEEVSKSITDTIEKLKPKEDKA